MKDSLWVFSIGFLAQAFFSARILVQWILSERARQVLSPSVFWILSIAGAYLLCIYGWLRDDFCIVLGQVISYYIYLWNLNQKGIWKKLPALLKIVLVSTPLVVAAGILRDTGNFVEHFFRNEDVPLWLLVFGSMGQIIFTLRFVYQWIYSVHYKESLLPAGFWIISLAGSSVIVAYGILRHDPVLVLGQSVGFIAYIRNLVIGYRHPKSLEYEK